MRIDPDHLTEFKEWMRAKLAEAAPVPHADMAEVRVLIEMMKVGQWPIIADISDRAESDVIGQIDFDQNDLLELDEDEVIYYKEFLNHRYGRLTR